MGSQNIKKKVKKNHLYPDYQHQHLDINLSKTHIAQEPQNQQKSQVQW